MNTRSVASKADKLCRLLADRDYRSALLGTRVAAAVEHDRVVFPRSYATIIDVGANRGQFALFARRRFPDSALLCFEPGPTAFTTLRAVAGPEARCVRCALGSEHGLAALHVARADDSSSILAPTALQTTTFAKTVIARDIEIEVKTLDSFIGAITTPYLLKVDVQGYELEVLRGGTRLLEDDGDLLLECSFKELYAAQPLADEVVAFLRPLGYHLRGVYSVSHGADGAPLQGDFFFTR
jgi:FkbM family methyltransferase